MRISRIALAAIAAAGLSACTTTPVGPVEVTRFHQPDTTAQLGRTTVFVESAPDTDVGSLELAPYKDAVARELAELGYRETSREQAAHIAQVSLERFVSEPQPKEGPVSVGVGGSTGSYGSGVGLGVGINLGGNKSAQEIGTRMAVSIRDAASGKALWEGRANFSVGTESPLAAADANAAAIADALFREFPGNSGETVEVKVSAK
ncbi:DUF4136 domain-containing protein [Allopontixanthobacter sp.]|uniref:DUF4136 domain-containing protein n=1 Tax=Allopontixanthobacter sp. TaxID=2906452 RepID=UPI002ABCC93A|nr:DUF4136 domain-containing protein [Allopontixanthobacter sp.]MDZ4306895.1 DUF4136 domain-containing protein [Allopontixanthobacter sp.]